MTTKTSNTPQHHLADGLLTKPESAATFDAWEAKDTYRKITWRLIPFLFICYTFAYLDRVNIGFAAAQIKADLGFSDAVYGLGAGLFFIGYFLFEIPSNLLLQKIGARLTLMRIMVVWGLISASFAFISSPLQFYCARFLLGAFEAGFFPGVVLYLTYWFPPMMRGRIIATFMTAVAVAGIIGGPLSGFLLGRMDGVLGWAGWQWMFVVEAIPTVLLGLAVYFVLANRPAEARWLNDRQKAIVVATLGQGEAEVPAHTHDFTKALRDPRLYLLGAVYFTIAASLYIVSFWLPSVVRSYWISDNLEIGVLTALPYCAGIVCMLLLGRHSDRSQERRWHVALCMIVASIGLVVTGLYQQSLSFSLLMLTLTTSGILAAMPIFWTIPTSYLGGSAAAGGIATINSIGLLGGFASPALLGWIKTSTGSLDAGLYCFAAILVLGAATLLLGTSQSQPEALEQADATTAEPDEPASAVEIKVWLN